MKKPKLNTVHDLLRALLPQSQFDLYRKVQHEGRTNMLAKHDVIALTGNKLTSAEYDAIVFYYKDLVAIYGMYKPNKRLTKVYTPIQANDFIDGIKVIAKRL